MAARMSRAFPFSPLAMVEVGDACSGWVPDWSGEVRVSAGTDGGVNGGAVFSDAGGSAAGGFMGTESNSVGWFRDAFRRARCDGG
jgi:hypothetical protein